MPLLGSPNTERNIIMKNTYSIATRNAIVEANLHLIDKVMRRNCALIRAAHMDRDDVYQQLAVRLIKAVDSFDPEKGALEQHISAQLQYEMLSCKRPYRLHGLTGLPVNYRGSQIISFESIRDGSRDADALLAA